MVFQGSNLQGIKTSLGEMEKIVYPGTHPGESGLHILEARAELLGLIMERISIVTPVLLLCASAS